MPSPKRLASEESRFNNRQSRIRFVLAPKGLVYGRVSLATPSCMGGFGRASGTHFLLPLKLSLAGTAANLAAPNPIHMAESAAPTVILAKSASHMHPSINGHTLLEDLDERQNDVLRQLDELDARIEALILDYAATRVSADE